MKIGVGEVAVHATLIVAEVEALVTMIETTIDVAAVDNSTIVDYPDYLEEGA